jgi:hypothetical protein
MMQQLEQIIFLCLEAYFFPVRFQVLEIYRKDRDFSGEVQMLLFQLEPLHSIQQRGYEPQGSFDGLVKEGGTFAVPAEGRHELALKRSFLSL